MNTRYPKAYEELTAGYENLKTLYPDAYNDYLWDYEALTLPTRQINLVCNSYLPVNKEPEAWYALNELMLKGNQVIILTPYIIANKRMYQDLTNLTTSISRVDLITNDVSIGDNPFGCADYLNQKKKILATGITIHEYKGEYSMHSKAILIDNYISIVGSFNFDMRIAYLDTAIMLVIDSQDLTALLRT